MNRHPLPAVLARAGRWLSQPELAHAADADYPSEDYVAGDLQHHIRRGDIIPRLRDPETVSYEYGLPEWCYTPAPDIETELARIQRITRAQWGRPASPREEAA